MPATGYRCPKCGHDVFETGEMRATGGYLAKFFDVQNRRFTTVVCARCRYTELFQADQSTLGSIFDFLGGG